MCPNTMSAGLRGIQFAALHKQVGFNTAGGLAVNTLTKSLLIGGGAGLGGLWAIKALVRRARWFEFAGKSVIVTGGSRGLGLVLARQLVDAGAKVAILARTEEDVRTAAAELRERGGDVLGLVCDISRKEEVESTVQKVLDRWGTVDVLFNVAGVIEVGPLDAMTLEDFHRAMDINCWGALHTVLAVLPTMRGRSWGRIVNVASIGGKQAVPHMLPYDVSKFALVGLSTGLRTELAKDGILVTTVSPTLMRTGSPRNAIFKGRHRREYAWFSIGGSLPVVSMDADRAASQILRACQNGDPDVFVTNFFNPAVLASQLAPTLTTEILSLVNRFLPSMGGIRQRAALGYESESSVSPSWVTALGDAAARRNNEMRPRSAS
jgi:NAD(P)-dependent dehydrogenase (short-subunit alcohol dehydrogenase family)